MNQKMTTTSEKTRFGAGTVGLVLLLVTLFMPKCVVEFAKEQPHVQMVTEHIPRVRHHLHRLAPWRGLDLEYEVAVDPEINYYYHMAQDGVLRPAQWDNNEYVELFKRKSKAEASNVTVGNSTSAVESVSGVLSNTTYTNITSGNGRVTVDFIQACYMPSDLAVCGVNAPVYYMVDIAVGTPSQPLKAILDINSHETHFATCNTLTDCPVSKPVNLYSCVYTTFDANISYSFNYETKPFYTNFIESRSKDAIKGCWGWDNVTLGGSPVGNQTGLLSGLPIEFMEIPLTNPNSDNTFYQSVLGLGPDKLVSYDYFVDDKDRKKYFSNTSVSDFNSSMLLTLKLYGNIDTRSYSMKYLGNGTGQLVLGAQQNEAPGPKYGEMVVYKDMPYYEFQSALAKQDDSSQVPFTRQYLNISRAELGGVLNEKKIKKTVVVQDSMAFLESTERSIYAPSDFVKNIAKKYGLKNKDKRYYINCTAQGEPLNLEFDGGLKVTIPWADLLFKNLNPATNTKKNQDCFFGLNYKNKQDYFVLGQLFMNNVYYYSNLETNTIGIAPLKS